MSLDSKTRLELMIAAMNAVGPVPAEPTRSSSGAEIASPTEQWEFDVEQKAMEIMTMASQGSRFSRALDVIATAHDRSVSSSKAFSATVKGVEIEERSRRAVLTVRARGAEEDEQVRTDRTDTGRGALMARTAKALVGHRVMVYIEMEETSQGRKVRILRHLTDLGPDQD